MFTIEQQARKKEIIELFAQGATDEALFAELRELNTLESQSKVEREGDIANIVNGIGTLKLSFAELMSQQFDNKPLFTPTEVLDYARSQGWKMLGVVYNTHETNAKPKVEKLKVERTDLLLFEIQPPGTKGKPTKIYKGDKFPALGIGAKLVWLYKQEGDLTENLMRRSNMSDEAQDYLESPEGIAETKKWVDYIATNAPIAIGQTPAEEDQEETSSELPPEASIDNGIAEDLVEAPAEQAEVVDSEGEEGNNKKRRK